MKYILPKPKKVTKSGPKGLTVEAVGDDLRWMRRVTIPANKALIDALEVGKDGTIVLKGKIVGLEMNERETDEGGKKERGEIRISVDSVETSGDSSNQFEQMAKDDE